MAKVSFSALIEEIVGKLAGSVFQDSYGGYQIRTRVSPKNPRTNFQQLRRGEFGFISALWRTLSPTERQTFIDAAASPSGGLNLFIQANVNLTLIGEDTISTYTPSSAPASMPMQIDNLAPPLFEISASGAVTTVPTGYSQLIFVTYEKAPTKIFSNPSQFSPVKTFAQGTDLSSPVDIAAEWIDRFGQFTAEKRICIKSALIDITNGNRTNAAVSCAVEPPALDLLLIDSDGTFVTDSDGTFITFP